MELIHENIVRIKAVANLMKGLGARSCAQLFK